MIDNTQNGAISEKIRPHAWLSNEETNLILTPDVGSRDNDPAYDSITVSLYRPSDSRPDAVQHIVSEKGALSTRLDQLNLLRKARLRDARSVYRSRLAIAYANAKQAATQERLVLIRRPKRRLIQRSVVDWVTLRRTYDDDKNAIRALYRKELQILRSWYESERYRILSEVRQEYHRMTTWSSHGSLPALTEVSMPYPVVRVSRSVPPEGMHVIYGSRDDPAIYAVNFAYYTGPVVSMTHFGGVHALSYEYRSGTCRVHRQPNSCVLRMESRDVMRSRIDSAAQAIEAGHLSARDFDFLIARSVGELKDLPSTVREGLAFLTAMCDRSRRSRILQAGAKVLGIRIPGVLAASLRVAASCYLAYKFAIRPTADDVNHVISATADAILDVRSTLRGVIDALGGIGDCQLTLRKRVLARQFERAGAVQLPSWSSQNSVPFAFTFRPAVGLFDHLQDHEVTPEGIQTLWNYAMSEGTIVETIHESDVRAAGVLTGVLTGTIAGHAISPIEVGSGEADVERAVNTALTEHIQLARSFLDDRDQHLYQEDDATVFLQITLEEARRILSGTGLTASLERLQPVLTTWELLPLSFVIDWFATTHQSVVNLQHWWTRSVLSPQVSPTWATHRADIYGIIPYYSVRASDIDGLTISSVVRQGLPAILVRNGDRAYTDYPISEYDRIPCNIAIEGTVQQAVMSAVGTPRRSGLYRAIRGPWMVSGAERLLMSLPKINLNLSTNKIATLFAMFGISRA